MQLNLAASATVLQNITEGGKCIWVKKMTGLPYFIYDLADTSTIEEIKNRVKAIFPGTEKLFLNGEQLEDKKTYGEYNLGQEGSACISPVGKNISAASSIQGNESNQLRNGNGHNKHTNAHNSPQTPTSNEGSDVFRFTVAGGLFLLLAIGSIILWRSFPRKKNRTPQDRR